MRPLLKVMLILAVVFGSTFVLGRVLGILTIENVRTLLEWAGSIDPWIVATLVVGLLFIDLVVAVPTLTVTILAGYFLGFAAGLAAALVGMSLAVFGGYAISRRWGDKLISMLIKDHRQRDDLTDTFQRHGPVMIMLARAAPMLPEITACMAGCTRMGLARYSIFFTLGTLPYAAIAAYAGSVSDIDNPMPAIYAALFLYGVMWTGWYLFRRKQSQNQVLPAKAK